jgi:hypothetical protein
VYGLTWFPENGEYLIRQGAPKQSRLGENYVDWRFRPAADIRLTVTIPDTYGVEDRVGARRAIRALYGWIPGLEIL